MLMYKLVNSLFDKSVLIYLFIYYYQFVLLLVSPAVIMFGKSS